MIFLRSVVVCSDWPQTWMKPRMSDFYSEYLIISVLFKMVIGFFGFLTVVGFTIMVFYKRCVRLFQIYFLLWIFYRKMKMDSQLQREKRLNSSSFHQQCLIEENIKSGSYQRDSRTDSYWKISLPMIFSMITILINYICQTVILGHFFFGMSHFQKMGKQGEVSIFGRVNSVTFCHDYAIFGMKNTIENYFFVCGNPSCVFLSFQNLLTLP